jgi:hypothetical protein
MCYPAPGLDVERQRLETIGKNLFLGIIGDANHSYGYHLCTPQAGDYSLAGPANTPVGPYACAIDIGMAWPASRQWLAWLIAEIREDRIQGIAEVIGSYDGESVRYWSDGSGWHQAGDPYQGDGHDTWTHVAIYRSTAKVDHGILAGWSATGYQGDDMRPEQDHLFNIMASRIESLHQGLTAATSGVAPDIIGEPNAIQRALSAIPGVDTEALAAAIAEQLKPVISAAVAEEFAARLHKPNGR